MQSPHAGESRPQTMPFEHLPAPWVHRKDDRQVLLDRLQNVQDSRGILSSVNVGGPVEGHDSELALL